jgi:hypothetical protein
MARGPYTGRTPAAMHRALAQLKAACDALPAQQSTEPVAGPIFGNSAPPVPTPLPDDLPPGVAAAFTGLQAALSSPPCLGDQWPFANPPAVQAAIDAEKQPRKGRPSTVKPNQVVRLVRFVRLGYSVTSAASKAGLRRGTAINILNGRHSMAHHPAVQAAGVDLPRPTGSPHSQKCVKNSQEGAGRAVEKPEGHGKGGAYHAPVARQTDAAGVTA